MELIITPLAVVAGHKVRQTTVDDDDDVVTNTRLVGGVEEEELLGSKSKRKVKLFLFLVHLVRSSQSQVHILKIEHVLQAPPPHTLLQIVWCVSDRIVRCCPAGSPRVENKIIHGASPAASQKADASSPATVTALSRYAKLVMFVHLLLLRLILKPCFDKRTLSAPQEEFSDELYAVVCLSIRIRWWLDWQLLSLSFNPHYCWVQE